MAMPFGTVLSTNGFTIIVSMDPHDAGPDGWLVSLRPVSVGCSVVFYQDRNPPGSIPSLTTSNATQVAWTDVNGNSNAAGTPIAFTTDATARVNAILSGPVIYDLYAYVTGIAFGTTGRVEVYTTPYTAPDQRGNTANFSQITIDSIPPQYDDNFELVLALQDAGNLTDA